MRFNCFKLSYFFRNLIFFEFEKNESARKFRNSKIRKIQNLWKKEFCPTCTTRVRARARQKKYASTLLNCNLLSFLLMMLTLILKKLTSHVLIILPPMLTIIARSKSPSYLATLFGTCRPTYFCAAGSGVLTVQNSLAQSLSGDAIQIPAVKVKG